MLNKAVVEKEQQVTKLARRLNTLENTKVKALETSFKANSEQTHVTREHKDQKENMKESFPKLCSLCEMVFMFNLNVKIVILLGGTKYIWKYIQQHFMRG